MKARRGNNNNNLRLRNNLNSTHVLVACFTTILLVFQGWLFLLLLKAQQEQQVLGGGQHDNNHDETPVLSLTSSSLSSFQINPVLRHLHYSSDELFSSLILNHPNPTEKTVVMEVGCFNLDQSAFAASMGFRVHAFDPSPKNFERMQTSWNKLSPHQQDLIQLHNKAVSSKSGNQLVFSTVGGTGDHVVGVDLDPRKKKSTIAEEANDTTVKVETVALDDVILSQLQEDDSIFLIKIDVQGHEADVLEGLAKSLELKKTIIRYILFEYWVDALDQAKGVPLGTCSGVDTILKPLVSAGYELLDLTIQFHPNGALPNIRTARAADFFRPLDPYQHCRWFYQLGQQARQETKGDYNMGYWTDILAVYNDGGDYVAHEMGDLNLKGKKAIPPGKDYVLVAKEEGKKWTDAQERRTNFGKQKVGT